MEVGRAFLPVIPDPALEGGPTAAFPSWRFPSQIPMLECDLFRIFFLAVS